MEQRMKGAKILNSAETSQEEEKVTQNDMVMAERLFGILAYVASSNMPYYRLISLLGDCRKKQLCFLLEAKGKKLGTASDNGNSHWKLEGENMTRSMLNYISRVLEREKQEAAQFLVSSDPSSTQQHLVQTFGAAGCREFLEFFQDMKDKKKFCQTYIQQLVKEAADIHVKYESLQKLWPQMFIELVRDAVIEMHNKDSYRRHCLQRVAEQKL